MFDNGKCIYKTILSIIFFNLSFSTRPPINEKYIYIYIYISFLIEQGKIFNNSRSGTLNINYGSPCL